MHVVQPCCARCAPPSAIQAEPLQAHTVVCTLPLGVLQRGRVAFDPPLPGERCTLWCRCGQLGRGWLQAVIPLRAAGPQVFMRPVLLQLLLCCSC